MVWGNGTGTDPAAGPAQVWDAKTGALVRVQKGHMGAVTCLAYAPTCKLLFSSSIDSSIGIWNDKGILLQARTGPAPLHLGAPASHGHLQEAMTRAAGTLDV
jgi:WD40 repeat protein